MKAKQSRHDGDEVCRKNNRKDTKRWCKGKEGIEHEPVVYTCKELHMYDFDNWLVLTCKNCGKNLELYFPFGKEKKQNPPEWVKEYRAAKKLAKRPRREK